MNCKHPNLYSPTVGFFSHRGTNKGETPYPHDAFPIACGKCLPCRINRRRIWTSRLYLEYAYSNASLWCTFTYSPEHLPLDSRGIAILQPLDFTLFLKRFRKAYPHYRIRYLYVGEYGNKTARPHYHALFFFTPNSDSQHSSDTPFNGFVDLPSDIAERITELWGLGQTHIVNDVNLHTIQYTCKYVVKYMTRNSDSRLDGRPVEFARMSRRPGIGFCFCQAFLDSITLTNIVKGSGRVPPVYRICGRLMPLGRYIINKLKSLLPEVDFDSPSRSDEVAYSTQLVLDYHDHILKSGGVHNLATINTYLEFLDTRQFAVANRIETEFQSLHGLNWTRDTF
ncbi:replication initiator protein [Termite gut associated microvirus 2]|nr:replication initiator protein [Termite gut associated microvirus 2]